MSPEARVAQAFLSEPHNERWGFDLARATSLGPAVVLSVVTRLEARGWLSARWEDVDAAMKVGRRPRRLYRLTEHGLAEAQALVRK